MALGGSRREILRLVLANGMIAPLAGIVVGGATAVATGRLLESYLFGVEPADPATFASVSVLIALAAFAAACAPALRAIRTDRTVALRHE